MEFFNKKEGRKREKKTAVSVILYHAQVKSAGKVKTKTSTIFFFFFNEGPTTVIAV